MNTNFLRTQILQSHKKRGRKFSFSIFIRFISRGLPKLSLNPVKSYDNASLHKEIIFKDNKDKAFVYRWINKLNGKQYLGSTSNGRRRLLTYFDDNSLRVANMPIYNAILKYGRDNFIFEIIEICQPDEAIQREQFYLDHFDFEYNVLAKADSILGYKHTIETLCKMKGRQNVLGYKHSPETLDKLRESQLNQIHSLEDKEKATQRDKWVERKFKKSIEEGLSTRETNQLNTRQPIKGKSVVVTNIKTNKTTEYISISEAALALNVTRTTLRTYIKNKTVFVLKKQEGNNLIKENFLITVKNK